MVLLAQLGLPRLKLELLLREVLLLGDERLLILVHFPALVKESCCRRNRVELLRRHEALLVIHDACLLNLIA